VHFSLVDPGLLAGAALLVVHSARRSFVPYLTELVAFGLGLVAAFSAFDTMGRFVHAQIGLGQTVAGFGSFLLVLVVVHALTQAPVSRVARWLNEGAGHLSVGARRVVAAMPALGVAGILITLLLSVMMVLPVAGLAPVVTGSVLGSQIVSHTGLVQSRVRLLLLPPAGDSKRILESDPVSNPGEDAFLKLQFPADLVPQPDPPAEDHMLQKLNQARAQVGLSPLRSDPLLQQAAREHSADMYRRHYFSHRTPDGKTPYDRLHDLRFHYVTAGENIAFAPDGDQAWTSLMNSPDHRANILNPDFRCVGIGAYKGLNGYEEMFTQDFADCTAA
jgi:uncharacterized protein YkwD